MKHISDPRLLQLLAAQAMSADVVEAAIADNCRFDERASEQRWQALQALLEDAAELLPADLAEAALLYKQRFLDVSSVPDSFLSANALALMPNVAGEQELVRLELLSWPLSSQGLEMAQLQQWHQDSDRNAAVLEQFLQNWNQQRDNRPVFATFFDEVQAEVEHADWPHQLRDRLGLGFYPDRASCPVALMRYSLQEVLQAARRDGRLAAAVALPTVLDGGLHQYFYPAPVEQPYGATLHLAANQADVLTAEILHFRIPYQRRHLWKLGWISQPHRFFDLAGGDTALREARDLHLLQLRIDSGRDDFAAEMGGRA